MPEEEEQYKKRAGWPLEIKKMMSETRKRLWQNPKYKKMMKKAMKGQTGKYPRSLEARKKMSKSQSGKKLSPETKRKIGDAVMKRWDRIGRRTYKRFKHPDSIEYREWRARVFERDNYTCQICGERGGDTYIQAHHIRSWAKNQELRFNVDNGITLCVECHKVAHKVRK